MPKYLPHGTQVKIATTEIGGMISVEVPTRKRGVAESTDTDAGGDRTYLAGLREGGQMKLTFRHDPADAGQAALETNFSAASGTAAAFTITLPAQSGTHSYTFNGFVVEPPTPNLGLVDDKVGEATATVQVTGVVTVA